MNMSSDSFNANTSQIDLLRMIENSMKSVEMSLTDDSWLVSIPSNSGWYFIETDTPLRVFEQVDPPEGKYNYNLPKKIRASALLQELGICILPLENPFYIAYSGEARHLRNRAKEHVFGHPTTYCLALSNYSVLNHYNWRFHFAICQYGSNRKDSKVLRNYGEQLWRAKHGWPILCQK